MIAPYGFPFGKTGTRSLVLPKPPKAEPTPRPRTQHARPRRAQVRPVLGGSVSLANENLMRGRPIIQPDGNLCPRYLRAKRLLDFVGAIVLLVALFPIMLVTLLMLCVTTKGRPLFFQSRVGQLGRRFTMVKFRTMRLDAAKLQSLVENEKDGPVFKNRRDPRVTRIGRILRSTSIDETPQLFNVLAGHMALVGPRPPVASEVAQYKAWQRRRLAVRPGLTCLWQISGRSEIGFVQWMRMDLWYLRNQSLKTDLELLLRTPLKVLSRKGAY